MKPYLYTLALTLMLAFIADTTITWRPFAISFARPWLAAGIILIMCGCICLRAQWYTDGLRDAEIKEEVIEEVKQENIKEVI